MKIYATNKIGSGEESDLNSEGVRIQTEPNIPPNAPTVVLYDEYSVKLSIETLTGEETGDSQIQYYDLEWDLGSDGAHWESFSNTLTQTVGESLIMVTINGLSSGVIYKFRYKASNIHGWSTDFSPLMSVKTLTVPHTVSSVTTTSVEDRVKIDWLTPYSGAVGVEILSYEI